MTDSTTATPLIIHGKDRAWEDGGLRGHFQYADLGIMGATAGRYHAQMVRATDLAKPPIAPHRHALDFQFVYIMRGWMRFSLEGQADVTLHAGDVMLQPPGAVHGVVGWSDDFELL